MILVKNLMVWAFLETPISSPLAIFDFNSGEGLLILQKDISEIYFFEDNSTLKFN